MEQPKVIFLDAVGTLFGIKGTVGEIYGNIARQFGVNIEPKNLDKAFIQSFKSSHPLAFPQADSANIPDLEFQWWREIAQLTFTKAGVFSQFTDFNTFFQELYHHFATAEPWYVYPDVFPTLKYWQKKGIQLGIISNFDSRIHRVLECLELTDFFSSVTLSSLTGFAKPESTIFTLALDKYNCPPQQAWHIGDSLKEDYYGAKAAGIKPFLIERNKS